MHLSMLKVYSRFPYKTILTLTVLLSTMSFSKAYARIEPEWGTPDTPKRLDWWVGASVGVTHSLGENSSAADFIKNYPAVDIQVGTYLTHNFGLRLALGHNSQLGRPSEAHRKVLPEIYDTFYRFQVLSGYVDAFFDVVPLFCPRIKYRPRASALVYVGAGGLQSFNFDRKVVDWTYYEVDYWDKVCWAAHAGVVAAFRTSPRWDVTLEGSYNVAPSKYDGVKGASPIGGYIKINVGFAYHFYEKTSPSVRLTTSDDDSWKPSYTSEDRAKARAAQRKHIAEAQELNKAQQKEKLKVSHKKTKEMQKATERIRKEKARREKVRREAHLYNEP